MLEITPSPRPLPATLKVKPMLVAERRPSVNGNYTMLHLLGKGATGEVKLAQDRRDGKYYAVKVVDKRGLTKEQQIRISREYSIMKHVQHPNLVRLVEVIENPVETCIVMDYASGGDLYTHIVSSERGRLTEDEARRIFVQIGEALLYMHNSGFVHRDVKPENILLGLDGKALLGDMGYGTMWNNKTLTDTACGSLFYASPEIVSVGGTYKGPEVDVWSLGCVLYVMTTGTLPFHEATPDETRRAIIRYDFKRPYHLSPELCQLLTGMLDKDPKQRITMKEALQHVWVKGRKKELSRGAKAKSKRRSLSDLSRSIPKKIMFWANNNKFGEDVDEDEFEAALGELAAAEEEGGEGQAGQEEIQQPPEPKTPPSKERKQKKKSTAAAPFGLEEILEEGAEENGSSSSHASSGGSNETASSGSKKKSGGSPPLFSNTRRRAGSMALDLTGLHRGGGLESGSDKESGKESSKGSGKLSSKGKNSKEKMKKKRKSKDKMTRTRRRTSSMSELPAIDEELLKVLDMAAEGAEK
ncbi:CAMK/RAD53 protein kinase Cds1 [Balamuthia mandrillaris]